MLCIPTHINAQGAMAGFGRKDKTKSVTGAKKLVFFYVRGCDDKDPANILNGKGEVALYHDILYLDVRNTNGNHITPSTIEFVENISGFRDQDGEPYEGTIDLDDKGDVGLPIPDAIYFDNLDSTKASAISFYRVPEEAMNIIVSYNEVFREEVFHLCDSGIECLENYTLDVRTIIQENCLNPLNLKIDSRNLLIGFQNRLVITIRDSKGEFPNEPCISLTDIISGFRNDQMILIDDKTLEKDSLVFVYYRGGGERTALTINHIPFVIPSNADFCSQNTNCVKADLTIPFATQDSFQSSKTIISDAHLPPDMKLFLMAKTAVELNEGFEVDKSNRFKVIMEDCTPPSLPGN